MKRVGWKLVVSLVLVISVVGILFDDAFASESDLPNWQLVYVIIKRSAFRVAFVFS